ncbi:MAG: methionine--tRNA ligase [Candidatus Micrarchaeaceae archaeon]
MSSEGKIIVTSALPYAEALPHLGNLVGSILPADIYYKHLLMQEKDAIYICGSDQHGTPIELQAFKRKESPEELSVKTHLQIKHYLEKFECTFTYYGRTHSEANRSVVYDIFNGLKSNGYIFKIESEQAYCNVDQRFLTDRFIEGKCPYCGAEGARGDQCESCGRLLNPKDLLEPHCVICGSGDISFMKTEDLALDLKKLSPKIKDFIERNKINAWSKNAVNKSLSYIEQGLEPRAITRSMKWGFEVPGMKDKVFYVWFDAPIGYIGITKEWSEEKWLDYWKGKGTKLVQFMGKDNIEFHTLMWPGMLIGSGLGFILPTTIFAYEFLVSKSVKFSKSKGVGLNIESALEVLNADYWRFALAYMLPETADMEFSIAALIEIINKTMNDNIGNFIHRVLSIAKQNSVASVVPLSPSFDKILRDAIESYNNNFSKVRIREALRDVVALASKGNEAMSAEEPWKLAKSGIASDREKFLQLISDLLYTARAVSLMLWPFSPSAGEKALRYFRIKKPLFSELDKDLKLDTGIEIKSIFSKVTEVEKAKLEKFSTA